jgi:hypothetical protein
MTEVTRRFIPQSLLSMTQNLTRIYTYSFTPMQDQNIPTSLKITSSIKIRSLSHTHPPFFTQEHCLSNVFEARIFQAALITILKIRMS